MRQRKPKICVKGREYINKRKLGKFIEKRKGERRQKIKKKREREKESELRL